jgi:Zn-dependent protease
VTVGKLRIRAGFVLLVAALVYLDEGYFLWIVFGAALLHELGHYIPLKLFGGRVLSLELSGGGLSMEHDARSSLGYGKELFAVLMGPAVSIGFALLFSLRDGMITERVAGMCLAHGFFNLLPMRGLDGGRALEIVLESNGVSSTHTVLRTVTVVCAVALGICCIALAVLYRNLSLPLALLYLLMLQKPEKAKIQ